MARATSVDSTWVGELASDVSIGGTSATLADVTGTNWPSGAGIFGIQIGEDPDDDAELLQVTRSSTTLTLDASTPTLTKDHTAGASIYYLTTAPDINAKLDSSALDTDGTLAANSDAKVATQKATKTYADLMVPKAGGAMTGTLVGKNGIVTDTAMGPRSNQFGFYSTSVALLSIARAGTAMIEGSPVSVKFPNQFIQADKGLKSTYYTADDAYRIYTPNAAADGTATLAANYTPGDGIMYFDDVSFIVSSGLKTAFSFTLDGTNWYVGTSVNSGTNSIACQVFIGTDTAYTAGVDYFQTPSSHGDNNCVMPTYGAPYMTVSVAATNDRNVWLPPRVSVGAWTKPAVACEYGILVDNVTAGKIITVRDGYDGRIISQVTGGASSYGVGLRIKYDGYTGYFPIGKDAAP